MPPTPQTQAWPADRALLLVHGVGSYVKEDYRSLLDALKTALGDALWADTAVYTALYDEVNDWFVEKTNAAGLVQRLLARLRGRFGDTDLGAVAAEGAGDVLWPVLSLNARGALREVLLNQIRQMVIDGDRTVPIRRRQKLYLVCHSLGCFHGYEALCAAASDPDHGIQPATHGVRFRSVVMVASPLKLIRTVAQDVRDLIPSPEGLVSLGDAEPGLPGERSGTQFRGSARRFVSLTGDLDPVGGHLFHRKLPWAYMKLEGQESIVEPQVLAAGDSEPVLAAALRRGLDGDLGLPLSPDNPHDWTGYVNRNAARIAEWLA